MTEALRSKLAPRGMCPEIGPETGREVRDGVACYVADYGKGVRSHRYVFYRAGQAISVLQVVSLPSEPGDGVTAIVYTEPEWRRQGIATKLLESAARDFKNVHPAPKKDQSQEGAAWVRATFKENPHVKPEATHRFVWSCPEGPEVIVGWLQSSYEPASKKEIIRACGGWKNVGQFLYSSPPTQKFLVEDWAIGWYEVRTPKGTIYVVDDSHIENVFAPSSVQHEDLVRWAKEWERDQEDQGFKENRAITIPRQALADLAKKLARSVASDLQARIAEKGMEVEGTTSLGDLCNRAGLAVAEGPRAVGVEVQTRPGGAVGHTAGGYFSCPQYGSSTGVIVVFLNEYAPLHRFLSPDGWGLDEDILRVLVHEYTHAVDPGVRRLCKGLRKEYPQGVTEAYYNDPVEVKATSAQAIHDVLPLVAYWRKSGILPRGSYFTPKSGGVNAVVREILDSKVLLRVRLENMTPRNQARVMRDLYRALEDEGLLDEPKKNPAGAFVSGEYWYVRGELIEVEDHERSAINIMESLGKESRVDSVTALLQLGAVRVYDGVREGGVPVTGLDVWRLDKPTMHKLQDVLLALKRTGNHEVDVDISSSFCDHSGEMEHLYLTAADVLEATSPRELRAAGTVVRQNTRS